MHRTTRRSAPPGFSLIELMVVVGIVSILAAIAIPSYMTYVRQSRRVEAKTALLDAAGREERWLSTNPAAYTQAPGNLGYTVFPATVGTGYYTINVCSPACAPSALLGVLTYTVIATPVAALSQNNDTQCTRFAVDSAGQQYAADATTTYTAAAQAYCWAN
jgi:type IV pilus assembly protein PilE